MHTRARCHTAGPLRDALARSGLVCALAIGCMALECRVARADPLAGIEVRWSGPTSCTDHGEVAAEARRMLPADGAYEATRIDIVVQELRAPRVGYQLKLEARSASRVAERVLELASCEDVREAAGLLVALTLDPEAVALAQAEPPPPTLSETPAQPAIAPSPPIPSPPERPAKPADPERAEPEPTPSSAMELGPELSAGAVLDSSVLPDAALGPYVAAGVRAGSFRLALGGVYLPGAQGEAATDGSIRATLLAGQLSACAMWRVSGGLEVGPCASAELGRYAARARGVTHGESDATLWAAGSAGAAAALAVTPRLAIVGSVTALVPFRRPVLGLREMEAAHVVPSFSLRAALGLRWF